MLKRLNYLIVLMSGYIVLTYSLTTFSQSDAGNFVLIEGAVIIDGISDDPITGHSLLIQDGIIREIIPQYGLKPKDVEVINLNGKYIIPGLIDSHVHWLDWMGELFINNGVTSIVALQDIPREMRSTSQSSRSLPRLFHSGGRPRVSDNATPQDILEAIDEWIQKEPDMAHFDTFNENSSNSYRLAAEEVHRRGFLIFGHSENAVESIQSGHNVVEHVWAFSQAAMSQDELEGFQNGENLTWATFISDRWSRLDRIIQDAVEAGAYLNPTLVYEWGGMSKDADKRELDEYRLLRDPGLVYYPQNIAESLLAKHRQIKNFSSRYENTPFVDLLPKDDRNEFEEGFQNVLSFTKRYVDAGGKIQAGTDTISGGIPGLGLHQEMEMLVEAGLTPMQAIKSATKWSAELLEGKNGALGPAKVGSIEHGNYADLVVLSSDPLNNISNTQMIDRVMKNGRWVTLGYNPEHYTFTSPSRSIAGATLSPVLSTITPAIMAAGDAGGRVVLDGSGFMMTSLVKLNGISVKTYFINPRRIEFELPASLISRPTPNPYSAPGPFQNVGIVGYRSIEISVFNPPPEGGLSNSIHLLVKPNL